MGILIVLFTVKLVGLIILLLGDFMIPESIAYKEFIFRGSIICFFYKYKIETHVIKIKRIQPKIVIQYLII